MGRLEARMAAHAGPLPDETAAPIEAGSGEAEVELGRESEPEDANAALAAGTTQAPAVMDEVPALRPEPEGRVASSEPEAEQAPLPALDKLVPQIPVAARQLVDELFRAKFVRVQRVPRQDLKA